MRSGVLAALLAVALWAPPALAVEKVVVLGFDGVDPVLLERYMQEGHLPTMAKLARGGHFSRLATTFPAQSPVSWSAFSIGAGPGKTGIFDFLTRAHGSYLPELALVRAERLGLWPGWSRVGPLVLALGFLVAFVTRAMTRRRLVCAAVGLAGAGASLWVLSLVPHSIEVPRSRRDGVSFWKILAEQGRRVTILTVPVTFPAENLGPNGRMLSGLGVPDVRRTQGTYCCFQDTPPASTDSEMGGRLHAVQFAGGRARTAIPGPPAGSIGNAQEAALPLSIRRDPTGPAIEVNFGSGPIRLAPHDWSPWSRFIFKVNPILEIPLRGRFHYASAKEPFRLYLSPLNFDPEALPPIVKLSWPADYAARLAREAGPYKTLGWATDTWAATEGVLDETAFMQDLTYTYDGRERVYKNELAKDDWDVLVAVFEETDRASHLFWLREDPRAPAPATPPARRPILETYRRMDATVARTLARRPDATLFVLSDHGFHAFRRRFNLNSWLAAEGFLTLRKDAGSPERRALVDLYQKHDVWAQVDWDHTQAFSMGLGNIWINVLGRDPSGTVPMGPEYNRVRDRIIARLREFQDPADGVHPVRGVYRREEVFQGPHTPAAPDLLVGFADGYRVSWQAALGGVEPEIVSANDSRWCGDHCSLDPPDIPGVLLSNRKVVLAPGTTPSVIDLAPTVLALQGVPAPAEMDGRALQLAR